MVKYPGARKIRSDYRLMLECLRRRGSYQNPERIIFREDTCGFKLQTQPT